MRNGTAPLGREARGYQWVRFAVLNVVVARSRLVCVTVPPGPVAIGEVAGTTTSYPSGKASEAELENMGAPGRVVLITPAVGSPGIEL